MVIVAITTVQVKVAIVARTYRFMHITAHVRSHARGTCIRPRVMINFTSIIQRNSI